MRRAKCAGSPRDLSHGDLDVRGLMGVRRIEEIDHEEFIGGPAKKVVIFLNIFNVHINRSPITGTVAMTNYRAGKMLPAYKTHASEETERNTIGS